MTTFGWCNTGHHKLCRHQFTSTFGVTHTCTCTCHTEEGAE